MNKKKKLIVGMIAVAAAFLLLTLGAFEYITRYRIRDIDISSSPEGEYVLLYQSVGDPDWPFGYSHARFVLKHNGKTLSKYRFDVANDGGILYPDSWSVEWKDDSAEAVVSGEEQEDMIYILFFDGRVEQALATGKDD